MMLIPDDAAGPPASLCSEGDVLTPEAKWAVILEADLELAKETVVAGDEDGGGCCRGRTSCVGYLAINMEGRMVEVD